MEITEAQSAGKNRRTWESLGSASKQDRVSTETKAAAGPCSDRGKFYRRSRLQVKLGSVFYLNLWVGL